MRTRTSLVPAEVYACHVVEATIVRPVEVAQSSQDGIVDDRMWSALGLAKTARRAAALRLLEAREALRRVEVEVLVGDEPLDAEEVLQSRQLAARVHDQPLAADEVKPIERESSKPSVEVARVQTDTDRAPRSVHRAAVVRPSCAPVRHGRRVAERHRLERRKIWTLETGLSVVGQRPGDWFANDNDQLGVRRYGIDSLRNGFRHEVARRLFHCQLAVQRRWHTRSAQHKSCINVSEVSK